MQSGFFRSNFCCRGLGSYGIATYPQTQGTLSRRSAFAYHSGMALCTAVIQCLASRKFTQHGLLRQYQQFIYIYIYIYMILQLFRQTNATL